MESIHVQEKLSFLFTHAVFPGFEHIFIIFNPAAGGIRNPRVAKNVIQALDNKIAEMYTVNQETADNRLTVFETAGPGDCYKYVYGIVKEHTAEKPALIVTAGGDGTGSEAAAALYKYSEETGNLGRGVLFRLPLGTGNDGLDAESIEQGLSICSGIYRKKKIRLLRLKSADGRELFAANILSFGLDAYVVDLTNRLKERIPGSFYSMMVDVAALFYETKVAPQMMEVLWRRGGDSGQFERRLLLLAAGVSGGRTYGGKKLILPGSENICAVEPMNVFRKLRLKNLFYSGEHTQLPEVTMIGADEIELRYRGRIPFQYDGEILWVDEGFFPAKITLTDPLISVINPGEE